MDVQIIQLTCTKYYKLLNKNKNYTIIAGDLNAGLVKHLSDILGT
jgi:hypothetical protein